MKRELRGVVLFETLMLVTLLVWFIWGAQLAVSKHWEERLKQLQLERIRYDGVKRWRE